MRLASLQLTAQGATGWKSPVLQFGHRTTSLYAKNGSGKTPLVHALAFCLGYPIIFRDDINDKCKSAGLEIEQGKQQITLERFLGREFAARVTVSGGEALQYFTEHDYSLFLEVLWCRVDSDRQSLRDRMTNTCLVKNNATPIGTGEVHMAYYFSSIPLRIRM
jgi:hypothetical protein